MEMLQGVWKQHLRPRALVGYGVKIFFPSPPNYVARSPGVKDICKVQICRQGLNVPKQQHRILVKDLLSSNF